MIAAIIWTGSVLILLGWAYPNLVLSVNSVAQLSITISFFWRGTGGVTEGVHQALSAAGFSPWRALRCQLLTCFFITGLITFMTLNIAENATSYLTYNPVSGEVIMCEQSSARRDCINLDWRSFTSEEILLQERDGHLHKYRRPAPQLQQVINFERDQSKTEVAMILLLFRWITLVISSLTISTTFYPRTMCFGWMIIGLTEELYFNSISL